MDFSLYVCDGAIFIFFPDFARKSESVCLFFLLSQCIVRGKHAFKHIQTCVHRITAECVFSSSGFLGEKEEGLEGGGGCYMLCKGIFFTMSSAKS